MICINSIVVTNFSFPTTGPVHYPCASFIKKFPTISPMKFTLESPFKATSAQREVIDKLAKGYDKNPMQTLLGITGSGKTFVMANIIEKVNKPTIVLAHNKTLAAQLYAELKEFFPHNRVEYFISYYDYYQPESYLPTTDTYIEKDADVNEQIEKLRLRATSAVLSRDDVIIVCSISCIYGLGDPSDFAYMSLQLEKNSKISRREIITKLIDMQYERTNSAIEAGKFRVKGDVIDVIPAYEKNIIRIELFGEDIDRMTEIHPVTGETVTQLEKISVFPAKQFVVPQEKIQKAMNAIKEELEEQLPKMKELEAQRLHKRVKYDLEMIGEFGYCSGIENYSRHFDGRKPGTPPYTLLSYMPDDFMLIIDESHQSIPQAHAMYKGDYSRKKNLVEFGFRLPCAFDNRPLKFKEFEKYFRHTLFVSATPAEYETQQSKQVAELIIRPTGLLDPEIETRKIEGQIQDLIKEIKEVTKRKERVLVTTLTKRMAEDLTKYLADKEINVRYMHSEIDSLDRIELIRQLRAGEFDVLVGINLLREGLDIPEVSLVAILDADKEGFLRNERSLIQTIGRAARNVNGRVIMYADVLTDSMKKAIAITRRRRRLQKQYNEKYKITPKTITKKVMEKERDIKGIKHMAKKDINKKIIELEAQMKTAAEKLDFEKAIELRDTLNALKKEAEHA